MLRNPQGGAASVRSYDSSRHGQLHGRDVLQQYRPGDGQLDVETHGKRPAGVEEDAAAREVDRAAGAGVLQLSAANQPPPEIQLYPVSAVGAPFAGDAVALVPFL